MPKFILNKKSHWVFGFVLLAVALIIPIISFAASSPTINEYPTTTSEAGPNDIITGPDGNLWFDEGLTNQIGKINPHTGVITNYNLPLGPPNEYDQYPQGMVVGTDGNLWFLDMVTNSQLGANISKITTSGTITQYTLPTDFLNPCSIVVGPDGNMWFTGFDSNNIGVANTSGSVLSTYNVPGVLNASGQLVASGPEGISLGSDGNLWFAEQGTDRIGKINPNTGAITTYSIPYSPEDTAAGPDGNVWFSGESGDQIGKINPTTGVITEYSIPFPSGYSGEGAVNITAGPDGNMWFSLPYYGLGMIDPTTGVFTLYATPNVGSDGGAFAITTGSDGNIWFTTYHNNSQIGDLVLNNNSNDVVPKFTSADSDTATIGTLLNFGVTASGTPSPSITESGELPQGVSYKNGVNGTGSLSGTAVSGTSGSYPITLTATNAAGSVDQVFTLKVVKAASANSGSSTSGKSDSTTTSGSTSKSVSSTPTTSSSTSGPSSSTGLTVTASPSLLNSSGSLNVTAAELDATPCLASNIASLQSQSSGVLKVDVAPNVNLSSDSYNTPANQVLYVDGSLGNVNVSKGATIKGSGDVGKLVVAAGAYLAPGHSPGCLTMSSLDLSGTYQAELEGTTACTGYDQVVVNGPTTLSGKLDVEAINGFSPVQGESFTIIKNEGDAAITGTFSGLAEGAIFKNQGITYQITYRGGTGNDVVIRVKSVDDDVSSSVSSATLANISITDASVLVKNAVLIAGVLAMTAVVVVVTVFLLRNKHKAIN